MNNREVALLPLETTLIYVLIVIGGIVASSIVIYAMRMHGNGEKEKASGEERSEKPLMGFPFRVDKTVPRGEAGRAKDELRLLDLEREILSHAIRRLYEAHAEGKITEEERERIADIYKSRMMSVKEAMEKDESLVALHELETMQEDLLKLFSDRFDELTGKIGELRSRVGAKPIEEITIISAKDQEIREKRKKASEKRAPRDKKKREEKKKTEPAKTEAEKRIEQIRDEVEKVLDRLGQMEIET